MPEDLEIAIGIDALKPGAKYRSCRTYPELLATWDTVGNGEPCPSENDVRAAGQAVIAAQAAAATDKAARQAAHAVQKAANQAALNGIDVTTLNANEVKALLVFVLSELGYVKKLNGTQEVNIP